MEEVTTPPIAQGGTKEEAGSVDQLIDLTAFPDSARDILLFLTPHPPLQESLKSLLISTHQTLLRHQGECEKANAELNIALDRIFKLETELNDVRSAASLVVSNQDEMLSSLERRYNEELASLQSISDQKIVDFETLNQSMFEQERTRWEKERNMLLSKLHSMETTLPVSRLHHPRSNKQATAATDQFSPAPKCFNGYEAGERSTLTADLDTSIELSQVQRYKDEIDRLHRLLEEGRLKADLGSYDEGANLRNSFSQIPEHPSTSTAVQIDASSLVSNEATPPHVTESDWIEHQSKYKNAVLKSPADCAMCQNYEHLLQQAQTSLRRKEQAYESQCEELTEKTTELSSAHERLAELEEALNTRSVAHAQQIEKLESSLEDLNEHLEHVLNDFQAHHSYTKEQLQQLASQYKALQADHSLLQTHYDALIGRRSKAAAELCAQPILLPSDKTELELLTLKLHEENLTLREAREHLEERLERSLVMHQDQLAQAKQKRKAQKAEFLRELDEANARLASLDDIVHERDKEIAARTRVEAEVVTMKGQISDLEIKLASAESDVANARGEASKLHQRLVCLQSDLDNTESVQADFVRLSQKLQMQLEKFRQQEHEVRWTDPEDALDCFACHTLFPSGSAGAVRKANCRHCGKVHCPNCLKHTFPSGLSGRPARVCDVCHTLLNKNAAPFFSTGFRESSPSKVSHVSPPHWRRNSISTRSESPSSSLTTPGRERSSNSTPNRSG